MQKFTGGSWTDITRSEFQIGSPSEEPEYFSCSASCMTHLNAGESIRCVARTSDIDLNSGSRGNTYLSIIQLG